MKKEKKEKKKKEKEKDSIIIGRSQYKFGTSFNVILFAPYLFTTTSRRAPVTRVSRYEVESRAHRTQGICLRYR